MIFFLSALQYILWKDVSDKDLSSLCYYITLHYLEKTSKSAPLILSLHGIKIDLIYCYSPKQPPFHDIICWYFLRFQLITIQLCGISLRVVYKMCRYTTVKINWRSLASSLFLPRVETRGIIEATDSETVTETRVC